MSARETVLGKVRAAIGTGPGEAVRRSTVEKRLAEPPTGVVPERGQRDRPGRIDLFCRMAESVSATVARVSARDDVPAAVTDYLRAKNLAPTVRMGEDSRLREMDWAGQKALEVKHGRAVHEDVVGVSHAFAGIAETGTVALHSGADNPTTVNFLPEHHIVVVDAADIAGDLETVLARLRERFGKNVMPRLLNLITGPSRSGDIEQVLLLGAHGPRAVHLIVVGG